MPECVQCPSPRAGAGARAAARRMPVTASSPRRRTELAKQGYDGDEDARHRRPRGVDSALVHHYFGTKADLFAETVGAPMRPDLDVPALLEGPPDRLGERLVRYILEVWEEPVVQRRGSGANARGHRQQADDAGCLQASCLVNC